MKHRASFPYTMDAPYPYAYKKLRNCKICAPLTMSLKSTQLNLERGTAQK